jgi:pyruvate,water dikinase
MEGYGLKRGVNKLRVFIMCEIPSNVIHADGFCPYVDGVSIGGNDLLQLTLGLDRDSERVANLADYENRAYQRMITMAIETYHKNNVKVGFCGQQPSDSPEFAKFLVRNKIDTISVTLDSIVKTTKAVLEIEG